MAIGPHAGKTNQGEYSIAIGFKAGFSTTVTQQRTQSIILNSGSNELNTDSTLGTGGFHVSAVRGTNDISGLKGLYYDHVTKEIWYQN